MRRKDRAVTSPEEIRAILDSCKICHVAMTDGQMPYVVPLNYGYDLEDGVLTLYFHSAKEGRKIDIWKKNRRVCFAVSNEGDPIVSDIPCESGSLFSGVIGWGDIEFLEDSEEKCRALTKLFKHQTGRTAVFTAEQAQPVCVYQIASTEFTGKKRR